MRCRLRSDVFYLSSQWRCSTYDKAIAENVQAVSREKKAISAQALRDAETETQVVKREVLFQLQAEKVNLRVLQTRLSNLRPVHSPTTTQNALYVYRHGRFLRVFLQRVLKYKTHPVGVG